MINKRALYGYIDAVAVVIILTIFFRSWFYLAFLIFLCLVPLFSFLMLKTLSSSVKLTINAADVHIARDEPFSCIFTVKNNSLIPSADVRLTVTTENSFYKNSAVHELDMPLKWKRSTEVEYRLASDECGIIKINVSDMTLSDITGIFRKTVPVSYLHETVILPHPKDGAHTDRGTVSAGMKEVSEGTSKGSDFSEVTGIREYIPGDRLSDIHWKLSAKKDDLMIKQRSSMSSEQIVIVPELYNGKKGMLSDILDSTYGLCLDLIKNNVPFSLLWWSVAASDFVSDVPLGAQQLDEAFTKMFYEQVYPEPDLAKQMLAKTMAGTGSYLMLTGNEQGEVSGTLEQV